MEQQIERQEHSEGTVARRIEEETAKLPSDVFLWAAVSAMATSAALQVSGHRQVSNFIGEWVPTLLIFGLYNKMVKLLGSDSKPVYAGNRPYSDNAGTTCVVVPAIIRLGIATLDTYPQRGTTPLIIFEIARAPSRRSRSSSTT